MLLLLLLLLLLPAAAASAAAACALCGVSLKVQPRKSRSSRSVAMAAGESLPRRSRETFCGHSAMSVSARGCTSESTQPPRAISSSSAAAASLPTSSGGGGGAPAAAAATPEAVPRALPEQRCEAKAQPDVVVASSWQP
jgi:hypothetical protein